MQTRDTFSPKFDRTYIIITTHPTQKDIDRANEEEKIVVVFLRAPGVKTEGEADIYAAALLQAWGINPHSRLIVNVVEEGFDLESGREGWIKMMLDQMENEPWRERPGVSSTSLSGANFLRRETYD